MSIKIKKLSSYVKLNIKDPVTEENFWQCREAHLIGSAIHINDVQKGCAFIANKIIDTGVNHDHTKISLIDNFFDKETSQFLGLNDHFSSERHHSVHKDDKCPDDVTLIDIIEYMVDVVIAATARKGRVNDAPISDEILQKAYKNTFEMLKREVIVEDDD